MSVRKKSDLLEEASCSPEFDTIVDALQKELNMQIDHLSACLLDLRLWLVCVLNHMNDS